MYVYCELFCRIIVYFEIVDYFEFCEKWLYELFFNEKDKVNIEYRKFKGFIVYDIILDYKCEMLFVIVEDICGLLCLFRCFLDIYFYDFC